MVKFKCIASGNIIEFTSQVDIDSMSGHEGYIRILDEAPVPVEATPIPLKAPVTRGRPKKTVEAE